MLNFLHSRKVWLFVGGIIAGKVFSSKPVHNLMVDTVAGGIKVTDDIKERVQNIKEEAEDKIASENENRLPEA